MINAKEARERALDIEHKKYQTQLENVTEAINNAVEKGDLVVTLFYTLCDAVSNDLRRLDYTVDVPYDNQDQCYHTVISW